MSSSNRVPAPCEATVFREQRPIGPIRMPMRKRKSFVEEFNRVYRGTGIKVQPNPTEKAATETPKEDAE